MCVGRLQGKNRCLQRCLYPQILNCAQMLASACIPILICRYPLMQNKRAKKGVLTGPSPIIMLTKIEFAAYVSQCHETQRVSQHHRYIKSRPALSTWVAKKG